MTSFAVCDLFYSYLSLFGQCMSAKQSLWWLCLAGIQADKTNVIPRSLHAHLRKCVAFQNFFVTEGNATVEAAREEVCW